mgnify:CR=1 FL=1
MELITVKEALQTILDNSEDFGIEEIDFLQSSGRILKENIVADRDFPPFNRVSMDGIAISSTAFNKGIRSFKIEGIQAAGSLQLTLQNNDNCIEVMTGAVLPKNSDVIIQYELLTIENGIANSIRMMDANLNLGATIMLSTPITLTSTPNNCWLYVFIYFQYIPCDLWNNIQHLSYFQLSPFSNFDSLFIPFFQNFLDSFGQVPVNLANGQQQFK